MDVAGTDAQHYRGRFYLTHRQLGWLGAFLCLISPLWLLPLGYSASVPSVKTQDFNYEIRPPLVQIPSGLIVGQTEVTQENWFAVLSTMPSTNQRFSPDVKPSEEQWPVESVSWWDALYYLNALSDLEGLQACYELTNCTATPSSEPCENSSDCEGAYSCESVTSIDGCAGYRLPTEKEWKEMVYGSYRLGGLLTDRAWVKANSEGITQPVGQQKATGWFLHDTHGNVWEWVWSSEQETIVALGCSILSDECDIDNKLGLRPTERRLDVGFRIVSGSMVRGWNYAPEHMILISAGVFWMGCVPNDSDCDNDEKPRHQVEVTSYYIDKTEVTVADYKKCVNAGKCKEPDTGEDILGECNWQRKGRDNHPVNCIDWQQAQNYCLFVGKRLPTEAEWEKAARAKDGDIYPWGSSEPSIAKAVYDEVGPTPEHTEPVASKPAGAHGLYDMAGNVEEWVEDCYDSDIYQNRSGVVSSPRNKKVCPSGRRVLRGGSFFNSGVRLRSSYRDWDDPDFRNSFAGFRCVSAF